jgi:hypothetical protein
MLNYGAARTAQPESLVAAFAKMIARHVFHCPHYARRGYLWPAISHLPERSQPCRKRMRDHAHFVQIRPVPVLFRFTVRDKNRQLNKGGLPWTLL